MCLKLRMSTAKLLSSPLTWWMLTPSTTFQQELLFTFSVSKYCQLWASQVALVVKNLPVNAWDLRDANLIPGLGRSLGRGHGNPLQYSCLENPMDRGTWWARVHSIAKSQAWLKRLTILFPKMFPTLHTYFMTCFRSTDLIVLLYNHLLSRCFQVFPSQYNLSWVYLALKKTKKIIKTCHFQDIIPDLSRNSESLSYNSESDKISVFIPGYNQGKLEVVKQEIARVTVNISGISKLKWTGMSEFNSGDHYIYYCGQESLRRNGVAIIVNKRVQNAVLDAISTMKD